MRKLLPVLLILLIFSCSDEEVMQPENNLEFTTGKNSYQMEVNGNLRNFHVFVPSSYDETQETPLVFMFHGSGGNGNNVYETSGWKEVAEANNFICVFPTALEYFVISVNRNQTKWSAGGLSTELEEGTAIEDDIPFVEDMLDLCMQAFNIDEDRIYASGFSNGGGFSKSRIMCELSDVFAAIGTAGGHGLPEFVTVQSSDLISLHTIMGNKDDKKLTLAGQSDPFPMLATEIMDHTYLRNSIDNILEMLQLNEDYSSEVQMPYFNTLSFTSPKTNSENEYIFRMVKDMGHIWPNGSNHPSGLNAAELFWEFFKTHEK